MITQDGCWADYRPSSAGAHGRPCLFLDRDGVLIEDTGYPHDPAAITLIPEALEVVRLANARGWLAGIVSNQSGVGRGYFEWTAFAAVQGAIDTALQARGARLDFVLACPHLADAPVGRYRDAAHPWRKPAPGMLVDAAATLHVAMSVSAMIGDRVSDMAAAAAAGVAHRAMLVEEDTAASRGDWAIVRREMLAAWFTEEVAAAQR